MLHRIMFAAVVALALAPAESFAAKRPVKAHHAVAKGGSWDGHWAGSWGGNDPTAINIKGGRVVSYEYGGSTSPVSSSHVTASRVSYSGDGGAVVTMTRKGANSAHATIHSSHGDGTAEMTRS